MKVKAAPGLQVPREDDHRKYITDDPEGVVIPHTHYYVKRLAEGDLVEADQAGQVAVPPAAVKKHGAGKA